MKKKKICPIEVKSSGYTSQKSFDYNDVDLAKSDNGICLDCAKKKGVVLVQ